MKEAGLTQSMSKKGCSPDNAACEGFFGRLKNEMFYGRSWIGVSPDNFAQALDDSINWYNCKRIKLALGGLSPIEYRQHLGCPYDLSNFLSARPNNIRQLQVQEPIPPVSNCYLYELIAYHTETVTNSSKIWLERFINGTSSSLFGKLLGNK